MIATSQDEVYASPFFEQFHSDFLEVQIYDKNFQQKSLWGSKFYAGQKFIYPGKFFFLKSQATNIEKTCKTRTTLNSFLPITFIRNLYFNPFQGIRNQNTILRFYFPIRILLVEKNLVFMIAPSANFECICSKNGTFPDISQKFKSCSFC